MAIPFKFNVLWNREDTRDNVSFINTPQYYGWYTNVAALELAHPAAAANEGDFAMVGINNEFYVVNATSGIREPVKEVYIASGIPGVLVPLYDHSIYINDSNDDLYYRDGAAWVGPINAGGGSGVIYTDSVGTPSVSTVGNRVTASQGAGADHIYETSQTIDPTTGDTINMNFGPGGQVNITETEWNMEDSDINYTNVTQNYTAPVQISCKAAAAFATPYTYPAGTNQVRVQVTNTAVMYTIWQAINQGAHVYTVGSGTITITTSPTQVTVASTTGANTLNTVCFYEGNVVNNNGTITNNTDVTVNNYSGVVNNSNTFVTNGGIYNNPTINNATLNNVTITGTLVLTDRRVNEVIAGGAIGSFPLANTPSGDITVSMVGGVLQVEGVDYTHTGNATSFTTLIDTTGYDLLVTYFKQ